MDIDLSEYLDEYFAELNDQLDELQQLLLECEELGHCPSDKLNNIFRIAHTIKGSAATMGFVEISEIAHAFEDLLHRVRDGALEVDDDIFKLFLEAYDLIKHLATAKQEGSQEPMETAPLVEKLRNPTGKETTRPARGRGKKRRKPRSETDSEDSVKRRLSQIAEEDGGKKEEGLRAGLSSSRLRRERWYRISMKFPSEMEMRSVRAYLVLTHLQQLGTIHECRPAMEEIENDEFGDTLELIFSTTASREEVENVLEFGEAESVRIVPCKKGTRLESDLARRLEQESGEQMLRRILSGEGAEQSAAAAPGREEAGDDESRSSMEEKRRDGKEERAAGDDTGAGRNIPRDKRLIEVLDEEEYNIVVESLNQDLNVFEVDITFRDTSKRSVNRALTIVNYLADMSRIILSIPTKKELERDRFDGTLRILIATEKEVEQLRELTVAEEISYSSFTGLTIEGLELTALESGRQAGPDKKRTGGTAGHEQRRRRSLFDERRSAIPTVRVPVERLDNLMNLVGELVIKKTQLNQLYTQFTSDGDVEELVSGLEEVMQGLDRITSDLQAGIMKVRMVQIGQVFYRFTRLVRDLSKSLGKEVEFIIDGADTELDKTVIDQIGDPLMHLIRNSLDHGIEPPEVRRKLGKPEKGFLLLRAQHAGDHIIVETADDGAGIDVEKIRRKIVEKGLLDRASAAKLPPQEVMEYIFTPGFSTSDEVSTLSGRGVGMDVVKETIERLQGDIQIKSEPHVGTTVQIKLPLTLAIIQGLLVEVCGEIFTIPLTTVKETIKLDESAIHTINNQKVIRSRDEVIPLLYLYEYFELPYSGNRKFFVVFVGVDDNKVGLVVDKLIGRREIVIKSLNKRFASVRGFAGGTVLGDGTVSLILDIPVLVQQSKENYLASRKLPISQPAVPSPPPPPAPPQPPQLGNDSSGS